MDVLQEDVFGPCLSAGGQELVADAVLAVVRVEGPRDPELDALLLEHLLQVGRNFADHDVVEDVSLHEALRMLGDGVVELGSTAAPPHGMHSLQLKRIEQLYDELVSILPVVLGIHTILRVHSAATVPWQVDKQTVALVLLENDEGKLQPSSPSAGRAMAMQKQHWGFPLRLFLRRTADEPGIHDVGVLCSLEREMVGPNLLDSSHVCDGKRLSVVEEEILLAEVDTVLFQLCESC